MEDKKYQCSTELACELQHANPCLILQLMCRLEKQVGVKAVLTWSECRLTVNEVKARTGTTLATTDREYPAHCEANVNQLCRQRVWLGGVQEQQTLEDR